MDKTYESFDWDKINAEYPITVSNEGTVIFMGSDTSTLINFAQNHYPIKTSDEYFLFLTDDQFDENDSLLKGLPRAGQASLDYALDYPITVFAYVDQAYFITTTSLEDTDPQILITAAWAEYLGISYQFLHFSEGVYRSVDVYSEIKKRQKKIKAFRKKLIAEHADRKEITILGGYTCYGLGDYKLIDENREALMLDELDVPFEFIRRFNRWGQSCLYFIEEECSDEWDEANTFLHHELGKELEVLLKGKVKVNCIW